MLPILAQLPKEVSRVWWPIPTQANARIAPAQDFKRELSHNGVVVMGGVLADGVEIPKNEVFAITSAGCGTIICHDRAQVHVICAHAARDSLFDRKEVGDGTKSRWHASIIHALLERMQHHGVQPHDVFIKIVCGTRTGFTHDPTHPTYGDFNKGLIAWCQAYDNAVRDTATGEIDLFAVIRAQAVQRGVPTEQVLEDTIDTLNDTDRSGEYLWADARRDPTQRNLVLVHHRTF